MVGGKWAGFSFVVEVGMREALARHVYRMWRGWVVGVLAAGKEMDGGLLVPAEVVSRWRRLAGMAYDDLPEGDRAGFDMEAARVMGVVLTEMLGGGK